MKIYSAVGLTSQGGLKIIMPTTPADAKGLLLSAIRDPNPVLCLESHHLYGQRGLVPEGDYTVLISVAAVGREGKHLTMITCGGMVLKADNRPTVHRWWTR